MANKTLSKQPLTKFELASSTIAGIVENTTSFVNNLVTEINTTKRARINSDSEIEINKTNLLKDILLNIEETKRYNMEIKSEMFKSKMQYKSISEVEDTKKLNIKAKVKMKEVEENRKKYKIFTNLEKIKIQEKSICLQKLFDVIQESYKLKLSTLQECDKRYTEFYQEQIQNINKTIFMLSKKLNKEENTMQRLTLQKELNERRNEKSEINYLYEKHSSQLHKSIELLNINFNNSIAISNPINYLE